MVQCHLHLMVGLSMAAEPSREAANQRTSKRHRLLGGRATPLRSALAYQMTLLKVGSAGERSLECEPVAQARDQEPADVRIELIRRNWATSRTRRCARSARPLYAEGFSLSRGFNRSTAARQYSALGVSGAVLITCW